MSTFMTDDPPSGEVEVSKLNSPFTKINEKTYTTNTYYLPEERPNPQKQYMSYSDGEYYSEEDDDEDDEEHYHTDGETYESEDEEDQEDKDDENVDNDDAEDNDDELEDNNEKQEDEPSNQVVPCLQAGEGTSSGELQDLLPYEEDVQQTPYNYEKPTLTLYGLMMFIVFLMRLGRASSKRLRKKFKARRDLLGWLDILNYKINRHDKRMMADLQILETKINMEEERMEKKFDKKRFDAKNRALCKLGDDPAPCIGPRYDRRGILLEKKLNKIDLEYERYRMKKIRRWNKMKEKFHKKLKKVQKKQEKRRLKKCRKMHKFERKWNGAPHSFKAYIRLKTAEQRV
ncbi:conserved Plasmodium protein, unknown function [Plasmodium malariae]|uniref:Uncharacterized protein n=1 Tax=Plasmodium malariae TaxID=5858 RepID=A0A1A8W1M9_PLAMA|nr:conserved Plasmodium protein, unknown function [Plasmodium malariae]SBS85054.1 hypothetical protein PMALA_011540 [Plasmodium malariae]SCN12561.1 conserved Plasmodium protein, unknown function [Plasmodium malariae]